MRAAARAHALHARISFKPKRAISVFGAKGEPLFFARAMRTVRGCIVCSYARKNLGRQLAPARFHGCTM